jgi:hypothetical protein
MPERADHCPFLNRADSRCADHFTIEGLHHAFEHCFDRYKQCRTYVELLVERRVKRGGADVPGADALAVERQTDGNGRNVLPLAVTVAVAISGAVARRAGSGPAATATERAASGAGAVPAVSRV